MIGKSICIGCEEYQRWAVPPCRRKQYGGQCDRKMPRAFEFRALAQTKPKQEGGEGR